jgi:hypothetical protein
VPRRLVIVVLASLCALLAAPVAAPAEPAPAKHIFLITLENKNYDDTFGPQSKAPYLTKDLASQGQLLTQYYGIGHLSLGNYVAMVSGQSPNPMTQADCLVFIDVFPYTIGADGQVHGMGCVYPTAVKTIAGQLDEKGMIWKGYMEDMATPCQHPGIGTFDTTQSATAASQYAARHNPFVYFHSVIDSPSCAANDVPLDRLEADLASEGTTPNYAFITPDLCADAHDAACADGGKGGLEASNDFLQKWVPKILAAPAFKRDGLLIVTFDESEHGAEGCCVQDAPNTPNAGATTFGPGGGRVGAVLISRFIAPGTRNDHPYNHYSLLRSTEDLLGVAPLGYAQKAEPFGEDVFTGPRCFNRPLPAADASGTLANGLLIASADIIRTGDGGRRLTIAMAHAADLSVKAVLAGGVTQRVGPRRGKACATYTVTLPKGTRSVKVHSSVHAKRETRMLKAPAARAAKIPHR